MISTRTAPTAHSRVMLYLDTSCVLKLLWNEPETPRTVALLREEDVVVVSDLTWLETKVRMQGRYAAGALTRTGARKLLAEAEALVTCPPFQRIACPASVFDNAIVQVDVTLRRAHCRTLDRLHLATMTALGARRLLTNDDAQARAARTLGMTVLSPR